MRKAHLYLLLFVSMAGLVSNAEAKNRDKSWEFGAEIQNVDTERTLGISNSAGYELQFGYNFSSQLELQALVGTASTEHNGHGDDFLRAVAVITGNFFTERDVKTIPFVYAGLGVIQETRAAFTDNSGVTPVKVLESFDSSVLLTIGVGARTFFTDNWGVRYEARYNHHNSFEENQDEYILSAGVTWIVGGKK